MQFQCNVCEATNEFPPAGFDRDAPSCTRCGSTVRLRALLRALSVEVFGIPLALADFPRLKSIRGLGMTDQKGCASLLESRFDYRNTFYHEEPRFDISQPPEERGIFDFILADDIFEHVAPPVAQSLANACALLKPHGFLAMSVPYSLAETTREHFAGLHDSSLVTVGSHLALVNRTRAGQWQVFDNLVFHGGEGSTLEMRVFTEADLRKSLAAAGFARVEFAAAGFPPFGIVHPGSWSLPVIAAKQPFHLSRDGMAELMRQHVVLKRMGEFQERALKHLQGEFEDRTRWAAELEAEGNRWAAELGRLQGGFEDRTRWAGELDAEVKRQAEELKRLQGEFEDRTRWAMELDAEGNRRAEELKRLQGEFEDRTKWALELDAEVKRRAAETARLCEELNQQRSRLALWEASRWTHLGRALGLGPKP
jgi:SAM-dependent methyltransferase